MRYALYEVVQLPEILTTWDHYLQRYVNKERNEGDDSNQGKFCESGFIDVVM